MTDYFLKFTSEERAKAALLASGCNASDWSPFTGIFHGNGFVAEHIEVPIPGEPDGDGNATIAGYDENIHINLREYAAGFDSSAFAESEIVTPTTPTRVFV